MNHSSPCLVGTNDELIHNNDVTDVPELNPTSSSATLTTPRKPNPLPVSFQPMKSCLSASRLQDSQQQEQCNETSRTAPSSNNNRHHQHHHSLKRKVSFGRISIREHPRAFGDHPGVSSGPALSLGWYSDDGKCRDSRQIELPLDEYEQSRPPHQRRSRHEIVIPRHERQKILLDEVGVTYSELEAFQRETAQLKKSRRESRYQSSRYDDDDDENDNGRRRGVVPPVVKLLQRVGKQLFLLHQQESAGQTVEQKQLDELMARAAAAERIRQQHQVAYWQQELAKKKEKQQQQQQQEEEGGNEEVQQQSSLEIGDMADANENDMVDITNPYTSTATTVPINTESNATKKLTHSASEPYFLSLLPSSEDDPWEF